MFFYTLLYDIKYANQIQVIFKQIYLTDCWDYNWYDHFRSE